MESIYLDDRWLDLQAQKEEGIAEIYTLKCEYGEIKYTYIKRVAGIIDNITYYDIFTERGLIGPIIKNSSNDELLLEEFRKDFESYCLKNNIIAEYIRLDPWIEKNQMFANIYNEFSSGKIYSNDLTIDFFNEEYSSKCRNFIRKTMKSDIEMKVDYTGETINEFLELYNNTKDKYNISSYYELNEEFLKSYFEILKDKVCIVNAFYENVLISSTILLFGKDIGHYHFSANNQEYKLRQMNYLLYFCADLCKEKGMKLFDLGGATPNSGLEAFKIQFVHKKEPIIIIYKILTKIQNQKIYDKLIQINGKNEKYFPAYR